MHAEFPQNSLDVQFHRAIGNSEVARDYFVALPFGQQPEYLRFARRQIFERCSRDCRGYIALYDFRQRGREIRGHDRFAGDVLPLGA